MEEVFYKIDHLTLEEWEQDKGVVPPEKVTERALEEEKLNPKKRKIVHFMQPHAPFLEGSGSWSFREYLNTNKILEDLRQAYSSNIELLISEIERLKKNMEGKIVVTADHGELLGEYGMYSHPYGVKAKELREVPWHVIKDEEKDVESDEIAGVDF